MKKKLFQNYFQAPSTMLCHVTSPMGRVLRIKIISRTMIFFNRAAAIRDKLIDTFNSTFDFEFYMQIFRHKNSVLEVCCDLIWKT